MMQLLAFNFSHKVFVVARIWFLVRPIFRHCNLYKAANGDKNSGYADSPGFAQPR